MIKMSDTSMHTQLKTQLLERIKASKTNDKLPAERLLAEAYGVCRATVSKVMNELEHEGLIIRRRGKGTFIAPQDKPVIGGLQTKQAKKSEIIMAYPDYFSFVVWENVHCAELLAMKNNLHLINMKLQRESKLDSILEVVADCRDLRGILLMHTPSSVQTLEQLDSLGVPVIFLHDVELPNRLSIERFEHLYQVSNDSYKSGYDKMSYMLEHGHRRVAYVRNEPKSRTTQRTFSGIKQALYDGGLRLKDLIVTDANQPWDCSKLAGYTLTNKLLDQHRRITGIVYDTMPGAIAGLKAIYEHGLRCPEDISVICSSPENEYDTLTHPALSAIVSSNEEIIDAAMDIILFPKRKRSRKTVVGVSLTEGDSIRRIKSQELTNA